MGRIYWRRLDNQAKIFSLAAGKKYTSVFRLSVVLKNNIDRDILEEAVNITLIKYNNFKVKLRRGVFWYYLDRNKKDCKVFLENQYPFQKVNTLENNNYLFRVSYFKNKINIEFYHILTDGSGGFEFFKEIIYQYLEIKYFNKRLDRAVLNNWDFLNQYKEICSDNGFKSNNSFAYSLQGERFGKGVISISHLSMDTKELKSVASSYNATIGVFISAVICYAIYTKNYLNYNGCGIIRVSVPVDLKKYFNNQTKTNFFSHIDIEINTEKDLSFDDILNMVRNECNSKLDKNYLASIVGREEKILSNTLVRITPLFLKVLMVQIGSNIMKRYFTTTISNMGEVVVDEKYKKYIKKFMVMLSPDWAEKAKFGICSYNNRLVISIDSYLIDNNIENEIYNLLREFGIIVIVEGNGVKSVVSKKYKCTKKKN